MTIMNINHHLEKYSKNIKQSDIILRCPEKNCCAHLYTAYNNFNKVSYLQRNKNAVT